MGSLFAQGRAEKGSHRAPPPPTSPHIYAAESAETEPAPDRNAQGHSQRPAGHPFSADLHLGELDERGRPGPAWAGRARRLSRSNIVFVSRRMCYAGREMIIAVHLVDSNPVPLFGRVYACDYEGDGLYVADLDLAPVPDRGDVRLWVESRT